MTPANLKLLGHGTVEETQEEDRLADELQAIINKTREETIAKIREWITYCTKQGMRKMFLDEGPHILPADKAYVIGWLREQGLTITEPRFGWFSGGGRVTIELP